MEKSLVIEKLNNQNFMTWSFKMKMYLIKEGCWKAVSGETEGILARDVEAQNEKALSLIVLTVENDQIVLVRSAKTGAEAWNILKTYHQQTSLASRIRVMKKLFKMELGHGESMQDHLQRIFEYFSELSEMDAKLEDSVAVSVILSSLNDEYDGLITAMEAWDDQKLTLQAVKGKLMDEWEKKKDKEGGSAAFVVKKIRGREFTCFFCGKPNHLKRDCPLFKERNDNLRNKENESAKMARFNNWYSNVSFKGANVDWIVDSGASSHMCCDMSFFSKLEAIDPVLVEIADGETLVANKKGTVSLRLNLSNGRMEINLEDVLFVPKLKANLVSVRRLTRKGYSVVFVDD